MKQYKKTIKWAISLAAIYLLHLPLACNDGCVAIDSLTTVTELEVSFAALDRWNLLERDSTTLDSAALVVTIANAEVETRTISGIAGLSTVAVAEDCIFNSRLKSTLQSITITSSEVITVDGIEYEPGADLVSVFEAGIANFSVMPSPVEDVLRNLEIDSFGWSQVGNSLYFKLDGFPPADVRQSFTFVFQFSDQTLTVSSDEVVILVN